MAELETLKLNHPAAATDDKSALPKRPVLNTEQKLLELRKGKEDLLGSFRSETRASTGHAPNKQTIARSLDDYARHAVRSANADVEGSNTMIVAAFSDRSIREIYKGDPVLAIQMHHTREAFAKVFNTLEDAKQERAKIHKSEAERLTPTESKALLGARDEFLKQWQELTRLSERP